MTVGKVCTREVDTADPGETVQKVAQRMHSRKVGTLVVVNGNREPVGMITDRDLAIRVVAVGGDPPRTVVQEVMTRHPATVRLDASLTDALRVMRDGCCRRIPVVDSAGQLAGLLSLDDVLELLAEEFEIIGGLIREESPRSLAGEF
jgi:CBS domain-containing protein